MNCKYCGFNNTEGSTTCSSCGSPLDVDTNVKTLEVNDSIKQQENITNEIELPTKKSKEGLLWIIPGVLLLILFSMIYFCFIYKKPINKVISKGNKNTSIKFELGEDKFELGDKVKVFLDKGYEISNSNLNNNFIPANDIVIKTFYKDKIAMFQGMIRCEMADGCKYEDGILIKATFYSNSKVKINDFIKLNDYSLDEKLGKPTGTFYQSDLCKVWNLVDNKVGSPYYVVCFDTGGLLSLGYPDKIIIGVWDYEGEAEDIIIKGDKNEEKDNSN